MKRRLDGEEILLYIKNLYIDQVCFFLREQGQNHIVMAVQDGGLVQKQLPGQITRRMERAGIMDPFVCPVLEEELCL